MAVETPEVTAVAGNKRGNQETVYKRDYDLERRLLGYALTAGAAVAVSAQSAEASVITRTLNLPIPAASTPTMVGLDINNDGVTDFLFENLTGSVSTPGLLTFQGNDPNDLFLGGVKTKSGGGSLPIALTLPFGGTGWGPPNITVPDKSLLNAGNLAAAGPSVGGQLIPLKLTSGDGSADAFTLPLTFDDLSNQYWGWARVSTYLSAPYTLNAEIVDVGYETSPDTPIDFPAATPEPGTLGMLALGAAALLLAKRKARKV